MQKSLDLFQIVKILFMIKPDIMYIPFANVQINSLDEKISENFWCLILNLGICTIVLLTILLKFTYPWLTSPSGPISCTSSLKGYMRCRVSSRKKLEENILIPGLMHPKIIGFLGFHQIQEKLIPIPVFLIDSDSKA